MKRLVFKSLHFGCAHFPYEDKKSVEIVKKVADVFKPDVVVSLGDLVSCDQFSAHPPTHGMKETDYKDDMQRTNLFLDYMQKKSKKLVLVEGNHEYRVARWAAKSKEGKNAFASIAPHVHLTNNRNNVKYVRYHTQKNQYAHYKLNSRIVLVHGWSYAENATKKHLQLAQGKTIIHAHTHRVDMSANQNIWSSGSHQARSVGCLCRPIPMYQTSSPVKWVNAFVVGYHGSHSDTLYTVLIEKNRAVLPDGKEIKI